MKIKNIIPKERINKHRKEFIQSTKRSPSGHNQAFADPGAYLNAYDDIISKALGKRVKGVSGNYYEHVLPYYPHTDYNSKFDNVYNAAIPLILPETPVGLVVFDQRWENDSALWTMEHSKKFISEFVSSTVDLKEGKPNDYDITNKTNKEIDDALYNNYLHHYRKEDLYGLSGSFFSYEIGDILVFDNKNIHCTSYFEGKKLGLSIRFKIIEEDYG